MLITEKQASLLTEALMFYKEHLISQDKTISLEFSELLNEIELEMTEAYLILRRALLKNNLNKELEDVTRSYQEWKREWKSKEE